MFGISILGAKAIFNKIQTRAKLALWKINHGHGMRHDRLLIVVVRHVEAVAFPDHGVTHPE